MNTKQLGVFHISQPTGQIPMVRDNLSCKSLWNWMLENKGKSQYAKRDKKEKYKIRY